MRRRRSLAHAIYYIFCKITLSFGQYIYKKTQHQVFHELINLSITGGPLRGAITPITSCAKPLFSVFQSWILSWLSQYFYVAKLSLNFSFSQAEMIFILDFSPPTYPTTHPGKYQNGKIQPNLVKQSLSDRRVDLISSK